MTDSVDHSSSIAPPTLLQRHVQLETDHFCDCGYNLHGQTVSRDERLGFMIVRCPECGRFHPAGHGVAARSLWLGRFATSMLLAWVGGLVSFFLLMGFLLATWSTILVMENTRTGQFTADGQEVTYRYDPVTQKRSLLLVSDMTTIIPDTGTTSWQRRPKPLAMLWEEDREEVTLLVVLMQITAFLTGVVAAIATWHTRKRFMPAWLIYPFISAALAWLFVIYVEQRTSPGLMSWSISRFGFWAAVECIGLIVGLYLGRPLARVLVKVFVPPKARHAMAFLWKADGLELSSRRL